MVENISIKELKFREVAGKRTVRILDALRLLGQCANRRSYQYTDAQVDKIFREVRRALRNAEEQFKNSKNRIDFTL